MMVSLPPVYKEVADRGHADAWLERDGCHLALKRIVDLDPVLTMLPGAPTSGAAAAHARAIAERLEDVRLAAATLAGAAFSAELAIITSPYTAWAPLIPSRAWARPAVAAVPSLQVIIEACAAFEDALAIAPESGALTAESSVELIAPAVRASIGAVEGARAALPDKRTQATIALASRTIAAVSPCVEAVERGASVGSRSLITAIDRRLD